MIDFLFHITISISQLQFANEIWELFVQLDCFFQVLLIYLLSQMFVQFALLNDFFVYFCLRFWPVRRLWFGRLLIIESCKVQVFVSFQKVFIFNILIEVHIIKLIEVTNVLSSMCQTRGKILVVINQGKLGGSFGDFKHFIGFFGFHQSLLGITDFFNLLFLCFCNFIGESVKNRKHSLVFTDKRFAEFRVCNFLSHFVLLIQTNYNYKIDCLMYLIKDKHSYKVGVDTQTNVDDVQMIYYNFNKIHTDGASTVHKPQESRSIQSHPKKQNCKSQYEGKIQNRSLHKEDNIKTEYSQSLIDDVLHEQQHLDSLKLESKKITKAQLRSKLQIVEKFIEEDRLKKVTKSITAPSSAELQKCLKKLEQQFPNHELNFVLSRLHMHLNHNCKEVTSNIQNGVKMSYQKDQITIDNCFTPAVLRNTDEKRIALSFLNHGYGLKILREIINDQTISPTKYNNIITTIMKNTFRMIETTVKQLKKNIIPVGTQEERILRAPLVNCDKWLPQEQLQTFYNFVKGASGLDQVNIGSESACKLYNSIIKQLNQRANQERGCRDGRRRRKDIDFR